MWKVNGRRTPSDGKSSHCLWQGELKINCCKIRPCLENYDFLTLTFLPYIKSTQTQFYLISSSFTESIFKIIWIVCIELWEVYINFILSRFGIGCHLLAFSINKRQIWNIAQLVLSTILKDFFTSFIVESKILRNHWLRNYFVKLVDRGKCKIIGTRRICSLLAFGERRFLSL
jgi:hypothetical protein